MAPEPTSLRSAWGTRPCILPAGWLDLSSARTDLESVEHLLRRLPADATEAAIRRSSALAREAGAQVLLVGVPEPSLLAAAGAALSDHPMYERIATDLKLPLHGGGWATVLGDAALKSDQIHPNAAGYRAFAEALAAGLREHGLLN